MEYLLDVAKDAGLEFIFVERGGQRIGFYFPLSSGNYVAYSVYDEKLHKRVGYYRTNTEAEHAIVIQQGWYE